nr:MAG TPA_asm: hypothetical protein [Caudoviricetes sp.]
MPVTHFISFHSSFTLKSYPLELSGGVIRGNSIDPNKHHVKQI